jgi:hypothetical protein
MRPPLELGVSVLFFAGRLNQIVYQFASTRKEISTSLTFRARFPIATVAYHRTNGVVYSISEAIASDSFVPHNTTKLSTAKS